MVIGKNMVKSICATSLSVALVVSTSAFAFAAEVAKEDGFKGNPMGTIEQGEVNGAEDEYEYTTLDELQDVIDGQDGTMTRKQGRELYEEVEPEVLDEYFDEVIEKAPDMLDDVEPTVTYDEEDDMTTEYYVVQVDPCTKVSLEIVDQEDDSPFDDMCDNIKDTILEPSFGATQGETLWKKYGPRYYTASYRFTSVLGAVTIKMKSENHYEVGSSGITERMPSSEKQAAEWTWVESATAYGDIRDLKSTYKMEDKYAKKDGEDAHVKVVTKFWRYDPKVGTTAAASFSERLKVKLVKNDKKNKKAKVTHSWQML